MKVEFDFKKEESKIFGPILRPVARISFINNEREVSESVYVDSGADISLIPKSVGDWLGFQVKNEDQIEEIKGIGERGIPIIIKKLKIKIGNKLMWTRLAWSSIEDVPLLLGRLYSNEREKPYFQISYFVNK